MPAIDADEFGGFLKRVEAKLGKDKATALSVVLSDPDFQDEVLLMGPSPKEDSVRASFDLHGYVAGRGDRKKLAAAMRGTLLGVHEQLPLKSISPEEAPVRPMEFGLVEGLRGLCAAKRAQPVKMVNADFNLAWLEEETTTIEVLRAVSQVAVRFTGAVLRNLAVHEDAACKVMKQAYGKVREASKADDAIGEFLGKTEDYLYAPAQQAAVTRGKMDEARKEAFSAGEKQALRTAERNVRDSLADEIVTLSDDLRRSVERNLDDRSRPR